MGCGASTFRAVISVENGGKDGFRRFTLIQKGLEALEDAEKTGETE